MIGHVAGKTLFKDERTIIIETAGVGHLIATTPHTLLSIAIGENVSFWTHLVVKEDALDLYGFLEREELLLFRLLISVSGIGPKSALNVLALADMKTIIRAISSNDSSYLIKVSGIGKKLAEKIVLELKEKIGDLKSDDMVPHAETEAIEALEVLGYVPRDTREIVHALARESDSSQEIIRKALQQLGGR